MKILVFLLMCILPLVLSFGADERSKPIEVYVMFDNSISMTDNGQKAAMWLSEHIRDKILQTDDSLTIWSIADEPVLEYSAVVGGSESMEEIKTVLSSIESSGSTGNYAAAFRELKNKAKSNAQYAHSYIILATGLSGQNASLFSAEAAEVLKYSRSIDFAGWKLMIIGFGIEQKVKAAAAAYMNSQR